MRIPQTENVNNKEVLRKMGTKRTLVFRMRKRDLLSTINEEKEFGKHGTRRNIKKTRGTQEKILEQKTGRIVR